MDLITTAILTDRQKNDIQVLEQACHREELLQGNIFLSNAINFNSEIKCFYMLYDGETLVSFLAIFIPTAHEAEISAYILPGRRRQGHFDLLLTEAIKELRLYSIDSILFVHEPAGKDAKLVLDRIGAKYEYSEYLLVHNGLAHSGENIFDRENCLLTLIEYSEESIEDIAALNVEIFEEDYEDSYSMVKKSIESKDIAAYSAYLNNILIGVCNVNFESEDVSIFGFGISPKYQGKGYGKFMLQLLLDKLQCMNLRSITLEVNSKNNTAFNLYRRCGFEIKAQFDYYRKGI